MDDNPAFTPVRPVILGTGLRRAGALATRIPIRLLGIAFAVNLVSSLFFLLDRTSGTGAAWSSFPLDDSWIHLAYVRSLATDFCLCYNDGIWEAGTTSWGWVFLLTPFYWVGHLGLGINEVILTKFVGIGLGAITTALVYLIARKLTASRVAAILLAGAVTLEPTWAFNRISGMEGALVVATVFASTWAIVNRRWVIGGLLLAAAFWARPEVGFYVGAAIAGQGLAWLFLPSVKSFAASAFRVLRGRRAGPQSRGLRAQWVEIWPGARGLILLAIFPGVALVLWVGYNEAINGSIYPNTYLAKNDPTLSLIPFDNMRTLWDSAIVDFQSWLSGWKLPVSGLLYAVGAYYLLRRGGAGFFGLLVFPALLLFAVGSGVRFVEGPFNFFGRRYLDPAAPVIVLVLGIGAWAVVAFLYRSVSINRRRAVWAAPVLGLIGAYVIASGIATFDTHQQLTSDYSWNATNIDDEDEGAGEWLRQNAEPGTSVFVADAGAIRFAGDLFTLDGVGLNTHENIGKPAFELVIDAQPRYVAIWEDAFWDTLPNATKVARFETEKNTILGGGPVAIYSLDWSEPIPEVAAPVSLGPDAVVIDQLNLADRESEKAHGLNISFVAFAPNALTEISGVALRDRGISHSGAVSEDFLLATAPGRDVKLVLRYRAVNQPGNPAPTVTITANGSEIGRLNLRNNPRTVQETSLLVPGSLISGDPTRFEVAWDGFVTEFRWWTVDAGEGELDVQEVLAASVTDESAGGVESVRPSALPPALPEVAVVYDAFTDIDGVLPSDHTPDSAPAGSAWTQPGPDEVWEIRGGAIVETSAINSPDRRLVIDSGIADAQVEADVTWQGGSVGLVLRYIDESNWMMAWWDGEFAVIAQFTDGGFGELGRFPFKWGSTGLTRHLLATVQGPTITFQVDDTTFGPIADTDLLDATAFGLFFAREPVPNTFDNFLVAAIEP